MISVVGQDIDDLSRLKKGERGRRYTTGLQCKAMHHTRLSKIKTERKSLRWSCRITSRYGIGMFL